MNERRYLLFAGETFDAHGGWDDLVGSFESFAEAKERFEKGDERWGAYDWGHIIDLVTGERNDLVP